MAEGFVTVDGKSYTKFNDALEALREAWTESKKEAVAAQLKKATGKGKPNG